MEQNPVPDQLIGRWPWGSIDGPVAGATRREVDTRGRVDADGRRNVGYWMNLDMDRRMGLNVGRGMSLDMRRNVRRDMGRRMR